MAEQRMGEMIRTLRKEKQMSQSQLAEGICTIATLSRIENGSQAPSRATLHRLMEKLDWPGFSYVDYDNGTDLKLIKLRKEIIRCIEYEFYDELDELIWNYKMIYNPENKDQDMFLKLSVIVWERAYISSMMKQNSCDTAELIRMRNVQEELVRMKDEVLREQCIAMIKYRHPKFDIRLVRNLEGVDNTDALVLNNIAIADIKLERYNEAISVLAYLIDKVEKSEIITDYNLKMHAVLLNNQAVCALRAGLKKEAFSSINQAVIKYGATVNVMLLMKLLRTRSKAELQLHKLDEYNQDCIVIKKLNNLLQGTPYMECDTDKYLEGDLEIMIF